MWEAIDICWHHKGFPELEGAFCPCVIRVIVCGTPSTWSTVNLPPPWDNCSGSLPSLLFCCPLWGTFSEPWVSSPDYGLSFSPNFPLTTLNGRTCPVPLTGLRAWWGKEWCLHPEYSGSWHRIGVKYFLNERMDFWGPFTLFLVFPGWVSPILKRLPGHSLSLQISLMYQLLLLSVALEMLDKTWIIADFHSHSLGTLSQSDTDHWSSLEFFILKKIYMTIS